MDRFRVESDWNSDEAISQALRGLDRDSSPGNPFNFVANNGQLLDMHEGALITLVKQRLRGEIPAFPIRLFVKPEWHKKSKIDEGRFRLIWQVSVVDQVIDKMLLDSFLKHEVDNWPFHPSKVGWSYLYGGWKVVPLGWGYDRSAWDMSVPHWLLMLYRDYILEQVEAPPLWRHWLKKRFSELYDSGVVLQLSNGTLIRQEWAGVQKSGALVTLSGNSVMQVLLHHVASILAKEEPTPIWALGDDTVQPLASERYLKILANWVWLKDPVRDEFCGMEYRSDSIEPVYTAKHILNLCASPTQDLLWSYQLLYYRSKKYRQLKRLIELLGLTPAHDLWVSSIWG